MMINLSLKEVLNLVICPQVQVYFLMKNYKYLFDKGYTISMKYGVWNMSITNTLTIDS